MTTINLPISHVGTPSNGHACDSRRNSESGNRCGEPTITTAAAEQLVESESRPKELCPDHNRALDSAAVSSPDDSKTSPSVRSLATNPSERALSQDGSSRATFDPRDQIIADRDKEIDRLKSALMTVGERLDQLQMRIDKLTGDDTDGSSSH